MITPFSVYSIVHSKKSNDFLRFELFDYVNQIARSNSNNYHLSAYYNTFLPKQIEQTCKLQEEFINLTYFYIHMFIEGIPYEFYLIINIYAKIKNL